jgi:hypothetical protein
MFLFRRGAVSMLSSDAGVESNSLCEPPAELWTSPSAARGDPRGRGFAALSRTEMATRFLSWEGLSGKSYVFTVYAAGDCPAFCDAVLLAVALNRDGGRRVLAAFDTGPFPEPALARAEHELCRCAGRLEFHIHLLARSPAERRETLADLTARLTPSGRGRRCDKFPRLTP